MLHEKVPRDNTDLQSPFVSALTVKFAVAGGENTSYSNLGLIYKTVLVFASLLSSIEHTNKLWNKYMPVWWLGPSHCYPAPCPPA